VALRSAGVECHFAHRRGHNLEARLAGYEWAHAILEPIGSVRSFLRSLRALRHLASDFDLVHTHLPQDHLLATLAGARLLVRSIHHPNHLPRHAYYRLLLRRTDAFGLANTALGEALSRSPWAARPRAVLPVALEPRFRPAPVGPLVRQRLGIPTQAVVVGTIGKLDRGRGHGTFLAALARVPAAWGMVIGKGPLLPHLQRTAQELGIAGRVVWPGYVEEGLESLYAAMDLFVFPAAGSDWAHRAIAEAAGCGVPTLAADLPGVRDLVEPPATGELFPCDDAAALAVLLQRWAANPDQRREAGAEAARRAAARWTSERLAAACLELYRACPGLAPRPGAGAPAGA
jgi:glycosyltransferase involved in cell wall biosynthesis